MSFHSGFVTILGRPNVGKSTLLNALVGEKIAVVSPKHQTTRNRIVGILDGGDWQIVFLDTPGIHKPRTKLGEYMLKCIGDSVDGTDVLAVVIDCMVFGPQDKDIIDTYGKLQNVKKVLICNKMDRADPKQLSVLLSSLNDISYDAIIPVSASQGTNLDELKQILISFLPEGPRYYPDDMITDQTERAMCAEIIREKALLHLKEEVPHGIGVEMQSLHKVSETLTEIYANIYCERPAHKGIIIGQHGSMLKTIGSEARADIERLLNSHVSLHLWVKIRDDWRNNPEDLKTLGYCEK